ncbi:MAG: HPF/RaiA family ribosome-associated protein [Kofleriaceae bacterium]
MSIPTEITFHELDPSPAAEAAIERWVARLEQVHDRILHAHATVTVPHRHGRHREFEVHLKLDISGAEIVTRLARHEDVYVAIADAFRAARRQLLDELDTRRRHGRAPFVTRHASVV